MFTLIICIKIFLSIKLAVIFITEVNKINKNKIKRIKKTNRVIWDCIFEFLCSDVNREYSW